MNPLAIFTALQTALLDRIAARGDDPERGDVPGWVLVTVMSAGLVAVLSAAAAPQLRDMFQNALNSVTGP